MGPTKLSTIRSRSTWCHSSSDCFDGARVGYLYENPDAMLANQRFNQFERADYTVLGPMAKETIANYEIALHTAVPRELKTLLAATDLAINYLRRGAVNVVFSTKLSLGLKIAAGPAESGESIAARVREVDRAKKIAANSELAALERAEEERARERREAIDGHPARDGGRPQGNCRRIGPADESEYSCSAGRAGSGSDRRSRRSTGTTRRGRGFTMGR